MSVLPVDKLSSEDFRKWKVPQLKEFLRNHYLKTTRTNDELAALAFGAEQLSVPLKLTAEEEIVPDKLQYKSLLNMNGGELPDPYKDMTSPSQHPPEGDFNLEKSIDVETTTPVPLSLPELAS